MGLPSSLSTIAPYWDSGNYPSTPASDWASQPLRVLPPTLHFTPDVEIPAEYHNYMLGALCDANTGLKQFIGVTPAVNFPYRGWAAPGSQYISFVTNAHALADDPAGAKTELWYATTQLSTGSLVSLYRSNDGGNRWSQFGATFGINTHAASRATAMCSNPANGETVIQCYDGSITFGTSNGSAFYTTGTSYATVISTGITACSTQIFDTCSSAAFFNNFFVFIGASYGSVPGTTGSYIPCYTVRATSSKVYVDVGHGQIVSMTGFATIQQAGGWTVHASVTAGKLLMIPSSNIPLGNFSGLLPIIATSDGVTFTTSSLTSDTVIGCTGLDYSTTDSTWMAACPTSTGTSFYTSPDGITWVKKAAVTSFTASGLACLGSLWLASAGTQSFFSIDAGVTWHLSPALFGGPTGTGSLSFAFTPSAFQLIRNDYQLLAYNNLQMNGSMIAGITPAVA